MTKIFSHIDVCAQCNGQGYCDISPDGKLFPPLSPWGTPEQTQVGCPKCGGNAYSLGKGQARVDYAISNAMCTQCVGVGHFESSQMVNSMDSKGRGWRETKVTSSPCPSCFGKKKKLHRIETFACHQCKGLGTVPKWKKPLFSFLSGKGEVEILQTCPHCHGRCTEQRQEIFAHGVGSP